MVTKICKACGKEKTPREFYKITGDKYMSKCKRCFIDKVKIPKNEEKDYKKKGKDYLAMNGISKQDYLFMYKLMETWFNFDLRRDIHEQCVERWEKRYNVSIVKKTRDRLNKNFYLPDGSKNPKYIPTARKKKPPTDEGQG